MMWRWQPILAAAAMCATLWLAAPSFAGTFTSGSTGADGAFNPPTTVPPGSSVVGNTVTVPMPASGVFNFTTINIPGGVTVKVARNATNTPVTLLASGDATITGLIDIAGTAGGQGTSGTSFTLNAPGRGGPGGFDGGVGGNAVTPFQAGEGLGPGGGRNANLANVACVGSSGGFGTAGAAVSSFFGSCAIAGGSPYGNPQLLPLVGGSGGAGQAGSLSTTGAGGGGGGGALLLAASGTLTLAGSILASGGVGGTVAGASFAGSGAGGGVRLVVTTFQAASGTIDVRGGAGGAGNVGGQGRVRIEALNFTGTTTNFPGNVAPSVGVPGAVFPTGLPSLAIASVGGVAAPAAPTGSFAAPDVTMPSTATSPVAVVVSATTVPDGTPVVLRAKPQTGAATTATTPGLSGGTAQANLALDLTQPSVLSAEATFQIAALDVPVKVAQAAGPDDPVTHVRVSSPFGGPSLVTYLTRAGREIAP